MQFIFTWKFLRLTRDSKCYETEYFIFHFPVTDNKKDSQFLGSLELQLVAAHGFEPRTLRVWTACSSQLSYAAIWSWWPGLNWWPYPYQGYALPTELHQHIKLVAGGGLEPPTFGLWARRATELLYPAICKNLIGGGKGIRTPAPLSRPPGFQDRSLQPDLGIPPTGAWGRNWTGTGFNARRILSPVRLPIPPLRQLLLIKMVPRWRFELQTPWLKVKCSTDWASEA